MLSGPVLTLIEDFRALCFVFKREYMGYGKKTSEQKVVSNKPAVFNLFHVQPQIYK